MALFQKVFFDIIYIEREMDQTIFFATYILKRFLKETANRKIDNSSGRLTKWV